LTVIKIKRDRYPKYLEMNLEKTFYIERPTPNTGKFFDASQGKIG